ncbi:MAG: methionine aminotransferase [Enterobacterales bacterium]|nr:methionine aminotransferase [Enterobacterales bacterium]
MSIQSKLPQVELSIFTEMSALAAQTGAINLSQGFPEFEAPQFLKQAVNQAINQDLNQYSPSAGRSELLNAIQMLIEKQYGLDLDAAMQVTITSGATEALFVAIQTIVFSGDEVIIFDPAYDSYAPAIEMAGGKCVHLALQQPSYQINWQQLENAINSKTKAIIINSPHNPTGSLLNQAAMQKLQDLVVENSLYLISDEVYEYITFDGERHESVLRYPKLFARSFVISSFGKTFHTTGWKMGYCVAPAELSHEFRKIHQYVTFCSPTPFQVAIASMLQQGHDHIQNLSAFYQQKRDLLIQALAGSRFKILPAKGTYFLLLDYSEISDLPDREFCQWLCKENGLAAIPLSPFYEKGCDSRVIRVCFAKYEATLKQAAQLLKQL